MEKTKVCPRCGEKKQISEFGIKKSNKDGLNRWCKVCKSAYDKKYRLDHYEEIKLWKKENYENNKSKILKKCKEYRDKNKEAKRKRDRLYYEKNSQKIKDRVRKYERDHREEINKKRLAKKHADSLYKLKHSIRNNIRDALNRKQFDKKEHTEKILGCTFQFFYEYIESKFTDGMCWDRWGDIHLDHIIPISTAETEEDVIRLNHYTNFQPLWMSDNCSKRDTIPDQVQFKLL